MKAPSKNVSRRMKRMTNDLLDAIRRDSNTVENYLADRMKAFPADSVLRRSMEYSLFAGGKRIRPFLCLETAALYGAPNRSALLAAASLEMIHTYSLIHDDLPAMDNDDMRRGKPSNHVAFGEANAILAGDGLLSFAFVLLSEARSPGILSTVAKGALDMVEGQSLDLHPITDEETLYRVHTLKTAAMIRSSVLSGALAADAASGELEKLDSFSSHYGLLFQITDDILDVTGDSSTIGKTIGKDEKEGKYTFVTCYGIEGAQKKAADEAEQAIRALKELKADPFLLIRLTEYTLHRNK